ncbi:MAG: hypothetical protein ACOVNU_04305 [Candidatus Kapaibacteriota bacterium]
MATEKLLKSTSLANDEKIFFQLVKGEFALDHKYAIQYVRKENYPNRRVLSRESYSSKERAESVYESLIRINNYNKRYK